MWRNKSPHRKWFRWCSKSRIYSCWIGHICPPGWKQWLRIRIWWRALHNRWGRMFVLGWARFACKPQYRTFDCLDRGVAETCKPLLGNSRGQRCRGNQRRRIRACAPSPPWCRRPSRMNLVTNKFFRRSPLLETCQGWGRWWGRWSGRQGWRRWLSTSRVFGRGRDWAGRFVPVLCLCRRGKIHSWLKKKKKGQFYLIQKILHKFLEKTKRIR